MGNSIMFPNTPPTYKASNVQGLFWVPSSLGELEKAPSSLAELERHWNRTATDPKTIWIPAQYFPAKGHSMDSKKHVLLYFHGNACDLGDMVEEMRVIAEMTGRHVVHFEYPGYGICNDIKMSTPYVLNQWGKALAFFLIGIGCPPAGLVPFGRSIGSGPAAWLARTLLDTYGTVGGLILHSPYISIHALVADWVTRIGSLFVENYWNTRAELEKLARRNVPLLLVHGRADEVIATRHGRELYESYAVAPELKRGVFPLASEHNAYVVVDDLVTPIKSWFIDCCDLRSKAPIYLSLPEWVRRRYPVYGDGSRPIMASYSDGRGRSAYPAETGGLTKVLLCGCSSPAFTDDASPARSESRSPRVVRSRASGLQ